MELVAHFSKEVSLTALVAGKKKLPVCLARRHLDSLELSLAEGDLMALEWSKKCGDFVLLLLDSPVMLLIILLLDAIMVQHKTHIFELWVHGVNNGDIFPWKKQTANFMINSLATVLLQSVVKPVGGGSLLNMKCHFLKAFEWSVAAAHYVESMAKMGHSHKQLLIIGPNWRFFFFLWSVKWADLPLHAD